MSMESTADNWSVSASGSLKTPSLLSVGCAKGDHAPLLRTIKTPFQEAAASKSNRKTKSILATSTTQHASTGAPAAPFLPRPHKPLFVLSIADLILLAWPFYSSSANLSILSNSFSVGSPIACHRILPWLSTKFTYPSRSFVIPILYRSSFVFCKQRR